MRHLRLLALLAAASGCSGNGNAPGNDMSVGDLATGDLTGSGVDLATPPTNNGTKLVSGTIDFLAGVTSDDYAIYYQGSTVSAVSLAGGAAKVIDADSAFVILSGKTVMSFSNGDAATGAVTLTVWSSAASTKVITTNTGNVGAVSADGSQIAYQDNVTPDGALGDLFIANADGTNPTLLVAGITTTNQTGGCTPELAFTPTRLLAVHCPDPGDAGTSVGTLSSYLTAGGGAVDVATNLQTNASNHFFSVDSAGVNMVVFDVNGNMLLAAPDGTGAQPILDASPVLDGYVLSGGAAAIYITANNELKRVPLTGAMTPVSLGPTTVAGWAVNAIGPFRSFDDKWVVWYANAGSVGGVSDLFVSSTQAPGNAITLDDMTDGFIFGDAFTFDNSRVLFGNNTDPNLFSGTLQAQALPTGSAMQQATNVWEVHAGAGTKIVYSDNFTAVMVGQQTIQRGDLRVADAATNGAPKLIATQAEVGEQMSNARDKVVYAWSQKAGSEGLYVAPATP